MNTFTWIVIVVVVAAVAVLAFDWVRAGKAKRALSAGQGFDRDTMLDQSDAEAAYKARGENDRKVGERYSPNIPWRF